MQAARVYGKTNATGQISQNCYRGLKQILEGMMFEGDRFSLLNDVHLFSSSRSKDPCLGKDAEKFKTETVVVRIP